MCWPCKSGKKTYDARDDRMKTYILITNHVSVRPSQMQIHNRAFHHAYHTHWHRRSLLFEEFRHRQMETLSEIFLSRLWSGCKLSNLFRNMKVATRCFSAVFFFFFFRVTAGMSNKSLESWICDTSCILSPPNVMWCVVKSVKAFYKPCLCVCVCLGVFVCEPYSVW